MSLEGSASKNTEKGEQTSQNSSKDVSLDALEIASKEVPLEEEYKTLVEELLKDAPLEEECVGTFEVLLEEFLKDVSEQGPLNEECVGTFEVLPEEDVRLSSTSNTPALKGSL